MTVLAAHQPNYLPWLGFFHKMRQADVFVLLDDVIVPKNGYGNRCQVKTPNGPAYLTVPLGRELGRETYQTTVMEDVRWRHKHLETIRQSYSKAPFYELFFKPLVCVFANAGTFAEINIELISNMATWLAPKTVVVRSSKFQWAATDPSDRFQRLCRAYEADTYLSGVSGHGYLDLPSFERTNIDVQFQSFKHPAYPQMHGDFVEGLSALDLLMNVGPEAGAVLDEAD